jgi:anti-anti-sigma factor
LKSPRGSGIKVAALTELFVVFVGVQTDGEFEMDDEIASFRRVDRPEASCLVADGEIDLAVIDEFERAIAILIGDADSLAVLDLTGVTFFGSTGTRALVTARESARRRRVDLVVEPSDAVRRTLEITNLTNEFGLRPAGAGSGALGRAS